ncbi:hypothetical protein A7M79_00880 [Acinetobacter baumannii]|uniref:hypothetical protein n=1 Tax=Acinetobacter baumannii TaxID=470 RepID=UPI0008DE9421|nr:hypothetical protein [Acinetobacter baumannii]OIH12073.1 hypothetical protein A7M79_00880 [Acinetobacter baumannii]
MNSESDQAKKMNTYIDMLVNQLSIHSSLKNTIEVNIKDTLYKKKLLEDVSLLNRKMHRNNTICLITQFVVLSLSVFLSLAIIGGINESIASTSEDFSIFAFDNKESMMFAGWTTLFSVFYFCIRPVIDAFIFTTKQHYIFVEQRKKTEEQLRLEIVQLEHFLYDSVGDFANNSVDIKEHIKEKINEIITFAKKNNSELNVEQKKGLIDVLKSLNDFLKQDIFTVDINTLAQISFNKVEEDFSLMFNKEYKTKFIRNSFRVNKEVAAYTKLIEKILSVKN